MVLDLDTWLNWSMNCKYLPLQNLRDLCNYVADILLDEPNIVSVSSPVTVCGDIHGQYYDLEELFRQVGYCPDKKYIFLGDFVDRGYYSVETWTRLLILKAKYPDRIVLLRGNHESRQITQSYGFYDECLLKYGTVYAWKICCRVFDLLAIAALIDGSVFCVHGGLSPYISTLDKIKIIRRNTEIPSRGGFCDLVWSDPEDVENWELSPRGAGWLFGSSITKEFLRVNNLTLICRAHQLVNEGHRFMFDDKLVTIWSAPNYCYRCGNVASVVKFQTATTYSAHTFDAVDESNRTYPDRHVVPYFL